jgi:hypothetical protein
MTHPKRPRDPKTTRIARQRKLGAHESLAELERAQNIFLQSETAKGHHLNDDKSPLIGLMNCIICRQTMKIEKSSPDAEGKDIIQYRCESSWCDYSVEVEMCRSEGEAKKGDFQRWNILIG